MAADFKKMRIKLHSLVLFRNILDDPVLRKFDKLLGDIEKHDAALSVDSYADFLNSLFNFNMNFSRYIMDYLMQDENLYIKKLAADKEISSDLKSCLRHELSTLQEISLTSSAQIKRYIPYEGYMPDWQVSELDFAAEYEQYAKHIPQRGYGVFASFGMFTLNGTTPVPVKTPDPIRLADLAFYEKQRQSVLKNTLALTKGMPASNVLLYGDSGTGKSSTVKAVANECFDKGLRLVEVKKTELAAIPALIERLSDNPLKFILFVDDLSFDGDGDSFISLKAALEGSVLARTPNIAIYVTSNRRHLIKESFAERQGDELHINETIQQTTSLSDRFGLTIPFIEPDKPTYLGIVSHIAKTRGLKLNEDELFKRAEVFAIEKSGRSPRAASQLVDQMLNET